MTSHECRLKAGQEATRAEALRAEAGSRTFTDVATLKMVEANVAATLALFYQLEGAKLQNEEEDA